MSIDQSAAIPTTRQYSHEEKAAAVRRVRSLRAELGAEHGTVHRAAKQLGCAAELAGLWVKQADIVDSVMPSVTTDEADRVKALEQEVREPRRANVILQRAVHSFGVGIDCQYK